MAPVHGSKAVFKLDNSGGSLVDLTSYLSNVSAPNFSIDMADTSRLGQTSKSYVPGLSDSTISIDFPWDAVLDAHLAGLLPNTATWSFEYGPAGLTPGLPKYTGEVYISSYSPESGVDDAANGSAEFQTTGNVTRTTW